MSIYYKISAPAKLNLNLFVKHKMLEQLHFLESKMCFLELSDQIYFKFSNQDAFFQKKNNSFTINPRDNLILNAVNKFRLFTNWDKNFDIFLDKQIPIGAGLGGGSADAAATLILLRNLFNKESKYNKLSFSSIFEIGSHIGSDVPACLISKDLKLKGYAKEIKRINIPTNYYFLVINPNVELHTKDVFRTYSDFLDLQDNTKNIFFENIKIYNSLLPSAIKLAPQISDILKKLDKIPNIVAYGMSGSGSTCFGIFKNLDEILKLGKVFKKNYFIWYGKKFNYNINRISSSKMLEIKF